MTALTAGRLPFSRRAGPSKSEIKRAQQQGKGRRNRMAQQPRQSTGGRNSGVDTVTRLHTQRRRLAQAIHIPIFAVLGGIVGSGAAILIWLVNDTGVDNLWVYAFGVFIALVLKVIGQFVWLKWFRKLASVFGRRALQFRGIPHDPDVQVPIELSQQLSLTVPLGVTTAIATILATESFTLGLMSEFGWYLGAVLATGVIATALDALASPTGLYVLMYNRLPSEENAPPEDIP